MKLKAVIGFIVQLANSTVRSPLRLARSFLLLPSVRFTLISEAGFVLFISNGHGASKEVRKCVCVCVEGGSFLSVNFQTHSNTAAIPVSFSSTSIICECKVYIVIKSNIL